VLGRRFHVLLLRRSIMGGQVCIIQTTLPNTWIEAEVGAFSQQLVVAGAACVQHSSIRSVYRWEGEIESSPEWHLQLKVSISNREQVLMVLKQQHPYDVPQIVWFTTESTDSYSAWVESQ